MRTWARCGWLVAATVLARGAAAQQTAGRGAPPREGPRTLVGIVTDTSGSPVDSADVLIASLRRRTTTNGDGLFKFTDIDPGQYSVSVRRVGYYPQTRTVTVDAAGSSTAFALAAHRPGLPPVVTSAARGGLSGVIGDTAYNALPGAQVTVIAGKRSATSDSLGAFYMNLKPGRYAVRISRPGYTPRLVSVTVPPDSGRRVVVWLTPAAPGSHVREAAAFDSLRERLLRRNPVYSKIYTREDVLRTGMTEATQLATMGAVMPVDANCQAIVDGNLLDRTPLWMFKSADIEMMEVYAPKRPSYAPTHMYPGGAVIAGRILPGNGLASPRPSDADPCNGLTVWIWLRR